MEASDAFGVKDMLNLLNKKVDDVLRGLDTKADHTEVLKLRDRMHRVEGAQVSTSSAVTAMVERLRENRDDVVVLREKVETLEVNHVSEETVAEALEKHQIKQRNTFRWAVGLLTSLGVVNLLVNAFQGPT